MSKSALYTYHTDSIDFDAQIQEIDVALGTVDSCENHVASSSIDTTQVLASNDATVTPSMPDHTQISQEQAPHVAANRALQTWKRIARESTMETEITQGPTTTKRYRDEEMEVLPELPIKKLQVSMEDCQQNKMVEAT